MRSKLPAPKLGLTCIAPTAKRVIQEMPSFVVLAAEVWKALRLEKRVGLSVHIAASQLKKLYAPLAELRIPLPARPAQIAARSLKRKWSR